MFKVERHYNKLKISTGDGRPVLAASVDEACEALRHYHAQNHDAEACPFCRWQRRRAGKEN